MFTQITNILKSLNLYPFNSFTLLYLLGLLAFFKLNEIFWFILPNEELIVVFCFFSFVYFCSQNLAQSVHETLEARSTAIATELQQVISLTKESLTQLRADHQKQILLSKTISTISNFSIKTLDQVTKTGRNELALALKNQSLQKLNILSGLSTQFRSVLQKALIESFRSGVIIKILREKSLKAKILRSSLKSVSTLTKVIKIN